MVREMLELIETIENSFDASNKIYQDEHNSEEVRAYNKGKMTAYRELQYELTQLLEQAINKPFA